MNRRKFFSALAGCAGAVVAAPLLNLLPKPESNVEVANAVAKQTLQDWSRHQRRFRFNPWREVELIDKRLQRASARMSYRAGLSVNKIIEEHGGWSALT